MRTHTHTCVRGNVRGSVAAPPLKPLPKGRAGRVPGLAGFLWPCRAPCRGRDCVCLHSLLWIVQDEPSAWGQRKSQVHWCYIMFFFQVVWVFFPSSSLTLSKHFFFFILAVPLSSSAVTAWSRASVALVGFGGGSAFPFPPRCAESERPRTDKQNTLSVCLSAHGSEPRPARAFLQSCAIVALPLMCKAEQERERLFLQQGSREITMLSEQEMNIRVMLLIFT